MNSAILAILKELARAIERHSASGLLDQEIIEKKNALRRACAKAGVSLD